MNRGLTVLILCALLAGLFALPAADRIALAQEGQDQGDLELIVQADEDSVETVAGHIQALGGQVKVKYRNVPAIAITLPADQLASLASFPGVIQFEKDRPVRLADAPFQERKPAYPQSYTVLDTAGIEVQAIDPAGLDLSLEPDGYDNFLITGASLTWEETLYGAGTVVAVVDTGTAPNICLANALIGTPDYPDGFNATGDGIPANDPSNHYHGTFVGGVIASSCALDLSGSPSDPLYQAISTYLPWPADFVPIVGQAPLAKLYPVKVFDVNGAGSLSGILTGLDHILTLKRDGLLDIDIVNMSLGAGTVFDGRSALDRFLNELFDANILVVSAQGNNGPVSNTPGSPGTSLFSLSVGALDYAISSRIFYEYLGLVYGADGEPFNGDEAAGMGLVMRPTDETRVVNFSSRGPTSDGRGKPDLTALGIWNFHAGPQNELLWAGGTSFSSPTVAGVAALLNAYQETIRGSETRPLNLKNSLLAGANPELVGEHWRGFNDQGYGAVDAQASLEHMKNHDTAIQSPVLVGGLQPNVLGEPARNATETYESQPIALDASQVHEDVFPITPYTSRVTIEVYDIQAPDNSQQAIWPNALEFHVQDARRTDIDHRVAFYWYPYFYGDSFTLVIEDGWWRLDGAPVAYAPMMPGLMKVAFIADYSNEAPVEFKTRITRENFRTPLQDPIAKGVINNGDVIVVPVEIPAGMFTATFDLVWNRDWSEFPSSDIDLLIFDPDGNLVSIDGATINAPERAVIPVPLPGTWFAYIQGYELYQTDTYQLYLKLE